MKNRSERTVASRSSTPRRVLHGILAATVATSLVACMSTTLVDGKPMAESYWQNDKDQIVTRAAFDLACDASAIQIRILKTQCVGVSEWCTARQVGVTGCDRRAVYVKADGETGWVMNTTTSS